ncbi:related to Zn(II)2Cys6 transcriptional activator [Cephalotrichum gorgonifer]|uniref:Related to Zn(II)2Cys6 transcriptional activator n=1 Tax=Cephalotrichum gorgonifer TaxID=2041049 RepID=A0AAE8MQS8_9PEZI|nr:related to Zn(II)2Cys6 transcriptional activator [Cephalotrichum gorgonifer]
MSPSTTTSPDIDPMDTTVPSHNGSHSPTDDVRVRDSTDNATVPKPKRLACMICRRRKLKCDGVRPSCSTCSRLGHTCAYDEVRRKSGPKRGYVKALEERLKQVETMLKTQEPNAAGGGNPKPVSLALENGASHGQPQGHATNYAVGNPSLGMGGDRDMDRWQYSGESPRTATVEEFNFNSNMPVPMNNMNSNFPWEMIGLGLEEPLPTQETIDELHQIYFERIHPSAPMIHKYRYLAAMNLAPNQRPPVCLRYAIWTMACSVTDKYGDLKDLFYQRARKYVESDYIKGYGEHMISVAHAQTHVLLACYELKMMYFPRAWMNTGAAVRLCQMIGLHRLDGAGLDVKQSLPPPRDWTEREERRRTFWMAFCEDRYSSIGTGWPMTIEEKDIMTHLPASEEAFDMSRPEQTQSLQDAMSPSGATKLSPFGGIVLMACLFGRNLIHLHRPDTDDRDHDLNGEFWKRHRQLDNILLNTSLCLPRQLKLPAGIGNANIIFMNMSIHTSTICLHQAGIFKADKHKLPTSVSSESKVRCITAANEIASIMRMISHTDLSSFNPFVSFCLYVAARVFVQYLKSRPDDSQTADSLRFLLSAMNVLKRRNPLTESFLVQLDVDLEALGTRIPQLKAAFPRSNDSPIPRHSAPSASAVRACENPEGAGGIMAYQNDVNFLKPGEEDPNPATAPNLAEAESDAQNNTGAHSEPQGYANAPSWARDGQMAVSHDGATAQGIPMQGVPVVPGAASPLFGVGVKSPPGTSSMLRFVQSESNGDTNDLSTSPGGPSNGPTPNSSTASDQHKGRAAAGGALNGGSGTTSYNASPASAHQAVAGAEAGQGGFYGGGPGDFGMSADRGVTQGQGYPVPPQQQPQMGFGIESGWGSMQTGGQPGVTPVAEGVLRSLMNMGPMDAMDLSSWDSGN